MTSAAPSRGGKAGPISRLARGLRTPAATLILGTALLADYWFLPPQSTTRAFGRRYCFIPPTVQIDRTPAGLAIAAASGGAGHAAMVSLWHRDRAVGLWALTSRTRWLYLHFSDFDYLAPLTPAERAETEGLVITHFQSIGYINAPEGTTLAAGGIDTVDVIWPGYAHDAAALAGAILFVRSLKWAPTVSRRARRESAIRAGLCHTCGYDLAGTPEGPCPECGTLRERPR